MRFFNYEDIWILSHGNPLLLLEYFRESCTLNQTDRNINFIVNPKALVDAFWISDRDRSEYLGICSLRNYNDYLLTGDTDLSLNLIPSWVPIRVIQDNPLVTKTTNKIILRKEKL